MYLVGVKKLQICPFKGTAPATSCCTPKGTILNPYFSVCSKCPWLHICSRPQSHGTETLIKLGFGKILCREGGNCSVGRHNTHDRTHLIFKQRNSTGLLLVFLWRFDKTTKKVHYRHLLILSVHRFKKNTHIYGSCVFQVFK